MNELVSIIIPVYNSEKYLKQCLDSIKKQSYHNIEVVIVDDGSSDKSKCIVELFVNDNRFKYIYQENQGVSSARNTGLKFSSGQYIMFIDADDFVDSRYVQNYLIAMRKDNFDVVVGGYKCGKTDILNYTSTLPDVDTFVDNCVYGTGGVVWSKMYKREVLEESFFDKNMSMREDMYFNFCLCNKIKKVVYINDVEYNYRINDNSLSKTVIMNFNTTGIEKILHFLAEKHHEKAMSYFLKNVAFWDCTYLIKNNLDLDLLLKNQQFNKYKNYIKLDSVRDFIFFGVIVLQNKFLIKKIYKLIVKKW